MTAVTTDPYSGLQLFEMSHVWGHGVPSYPGQADVTFTRAVKHAQHGVLAWRMKTVLHTGTHLNAPIHLIQKAKDLSQIPVEKFFGNGVVLGIPKKNFETITATDLDKATPSVQEGDIVMIITGWHHNYSDGLDYYGEAPGLSKEAAEWLVSKKIKLVGIDTPHVDFPLATDMACHRGGPRMPRLEKVFMKKTGLDPKKEYPELWPAHKTLLGADIPTIEQVGGDCDELIGKRATFVATPWKLIKGDACPVRLVGMIDPTSSIRIPDGK